MEDLVEELDRSYHDTHERLNPIADDGHHVAVLDDVGFVGQAAVARDDVGAALLMVLRNRDVDDPVQRVEDALDAAAARAVDGRVGRRREHVPGRDDV